MTKFVVLALFVATCAVGQSDDAEHFCLERSGLLEFTKEVRMIPYRRAYFSSGWSKDENDANGRYPLTGMSSSLSAFDPKGFYVEGFESKYSQVKVVETGPHRFQLIGVLWPNLPKKNAADHFIEKYSSADIKYFLDFQDQHGCQFGNDLIVEIYKGATHVENISFHVKDMRGVKDAWKEEGRR